MTNYYNSMKRKDYLQPRSEVIRIGSKDEMMEPMIEASNPKADGGMGFGGEGEDIPLDPITGEPITDAKSFNFLE